MKFKKLFIITLEKILQRHTNVVNIMMGQQVLSGFIGIREVHNPLEGSVVRLTRMSLDLIWSTCLVQFLAWYIRLLDNDLKHVHYASLSFSMLMYTHIFVKGSHETRERFITNARHCRLISMYSREENIG